VLDDFAQLYAAHELAPPPTTGLASAATLSAELSGAHPALATVDAGALRPLVASLAAGAAPGLNVTLGPIPSLNGAGGVSITTDSLYLSAASTLLQRAGAWRFVDWFEQPTQQARWAVLTGGFPARGSATTDPSVMGLWSAFPLLRQAWILLIASPWRVPDLIGPTTSPLGGVGDALERAQTELAHGASAATVLAEATTRADDAIAAYNADPSSWNRCDGLDNPGCAS
jgi:ABC-type glycerol-3-phosphate transport system substrate-binding protein